VVSVVLVFLTAFFFGDSRVFGDLAFGDSVFFFGDFVDLAFAALAFLGDVASFLGLVVVVFLAVEEVDDVDTFFVATFLGEDLAVVVFLVVDFLVGVIDVFFELDVDLFFGDDGTVKPEVDCVVVVEVEDFFAVVFFFFLSLDCAPGISL